MRDGRIGIGVVGYGYWGPNLVRNFVNSESARVISVSDLDPAKLAVSKRLHSEIETTSEKHIITTAFVRVWVSFKATST
jgi:predicted dehydrogenase